MDSVNRKDGYFPSNFFKRSNRIVVASEGVYIRSREGQMIGPFSTFREAEINLREFLRKVDTSASIATSNASIATSNNNTPARFYSST